MFADESCPFRREQRRVAVAMGAAALVTAALFAFAWSRMAGGSDTVPLAERVGAVLRFEVFGILPLALAIGNVARLRFRSPGDIAGSAAGGGSGPVREGVAMLQNTLEQTALAIPAHLGLAAILERPAALVTAAIALFCIGRAAFAIGYAGGAGTRAFGFALTFYPTLACIGIAIAARAAG